MLPQGLTTAPVLFALEQPAHRRELTDMIQRGYKVLYCCCFTAALLLYCCFPACVAAVS
jgi:hypothetical protein